MEGNTSTTLVHKEEGLTFTWSGGHTPILVTNGGTEIGAINMSKEVKDFDLADTTGKLSEHMDFFRDLCHVFLQEHLWKGEVATKHRIEKVITNVEWPELITEIHRAENTWSFHTVVPDTTHRWNVQPFNTGEEFDTSPTYREAGVETYSDDGIEGARAQLLADGFHPVPFTELSSELRYFITQNQAPIEVQGGLHDGLDDYVGRITLWVKGELPS